MSQPNQTCFKQGDDVPPWILKADPPNVVSVTFGCAVIAEHTEKGVVLHWQGLTEGQTAIIVEGIKRGARPVVCLTGAPTYLNLSLR